MILNAKNSKIIFWAYKPYYAKKTRSGTAPVQNYDNHHPHHHCHHHHRYRYNGPHLDFHHLSPHLCYNQIPLIDHHHNQQYFHNNQSSLTYYQSNGQVNVPIGLQESVSLMVNQVKAK